LGLIGTRAGVMPGLLTGFASSATDQGMLMPIDPAMLARTTGTVHNLDPIRDQPAARQQAVLAAEQTEQPDRDGQTPRPDT
jgi:hypothetical protein